MLVVDIREKNITYNKPITYKSKFEFSFYSSLHYFNIPQKIALSF